MGVILKNLYWVAGAVLAIFGLVFTEGSLIVTTKLFGVTKATLIRVSFTIPLSWLVIYLATRSRKGFYFGNWLAEKEARLSNRARIALRGGEVLSVINIAIFLGPIIASIFMVMIGISSLKVYLYAVGCAVLCAWIWAMFYSGMLWGIMRIFF